jgi:Fic family protein
MLLLYLLIDSKEKYEFTRRNQKMDIAVSTKKYISLTKVSKATAVKDISQLVEYGCIKKIEGSNGRNIRYELDIDK